MITSRAVFALHYCITGVSSRRHAATRDYAETLRGRASSVPINRRWTRYPELTDASLPRAPKPEAANRALHTAADASSSAPPPMSALPNRAVPATPHHRGHMGQRPLDRHRPRFQRYLRYPSDGDLRYRGSLQLRSRVTRSCGNSVVPLLIRQPQPQKTLRSHASDGR
jgi:hypothetical protein